MHETVDDTVTEESSNATQISYGTSESYATPTTEHLSREEREGLDISSLTISPSQDTPRPPQATTKTPKAKDQPNFADYPSPYEDLRKELTQKENGIKYPRASFAPSPSTPDKPLNTHADIAMTPVSSPYFQQATNTQTRPGLSERKKTDPLLHRVLDKNYRVQATPLTTNRYRSANATATPQTKLFTDRDLSFSSSPPIPEAPQLHAEIFSSPLRAAPRSTKKKARYHQPQPRTPGVSVFTPGKPRATATTTPKDGIWDSDDDIQTGGGNITRGNAFEDDGDDNGDGDDDTTDSLPYDRSPPKTLQFHIPQSRLLRTPARDASNRIVDDLIFSARRPGAAGGSGEEEIDFTEDDIDYGFDGEGEDVGGARGLEDTSPSVVRHAVGFEDETF